MGARHDARAVALAAGSYIGISTLGYIVIVYFVSYATRELKFPLTTTLALLLTAAVMFAFAVALVYAYRLAAGGSSDQVLDLVFIIFGTAVAGAVGVRVARVSWRETAFAALLSAIGLIIFSRFVPSFPGPWIPGGPGSVLDLTTTLVFLAIGMAGIFFLPLFDPEVRRAGPAPSLGLVALVAVTLTVLAVLLDYLVGDGSFFGLLTQDDQVTLRAYPVDEADELLDQVAPLAAEPDMLRSEGAKARGLVDAPKVHADVLADLSVPARRRRLERASTSRSRPIRSRRSGALRSACPTRATRLRFPRRSPSTCRSRPASAPRSTR